MLFYILDKKYSNIKVDLNLILNLLLSKCAFVAITNFYATEDTYPANFLAWKNFFLIFLSIILFYLVDVICDLELTSKNENYVYHLYVVTPR